MNSPSKSLFILALRAVAALIILMHHYALYAPLRDWAAPLAGDVLDWFASYARATQVFFVVGGYVAAHTIGSRQWSLQHLWRFVLQRYCRLGLPSLAVVVMILPIYAFARGWVSDDVLGAVVTVPQFLAHLVFLQDILGYEALSTGLWFVCINFQLSIAYALILACEHHFRGKGDGWFMRLGWLAAVCSLFFFNLNPEWDIWGLYFFPYFFMGIIVYRAVRGQGKAFLAYQLLLIAAICVEWRWRLVIAMMFGMALYVAERSGLGERWPRSRWLASLGRISFSLFLVHFPVLVLVGGLWARLGWDTPLAAIGGLLVAVGLALLVAALFHRWIEEPARRLSHRFRAPALPMDASASGQKARGLAWET